MSCPSATCQCCGDRLIHQSAKSHNESSSALGQYVHDNLPTHFYFADIDAAIYKNATQILRIVEHKNPGQHIRPSQKRLLPLLSVAVMGLVNAELVHPQSGVFAMWGEAPFQSAAVTQVVPRQDASTWVNPARATTLTTTGLRRFLGGEPMSNDLAEGIF
jgi:hypothetical protein